MRTNNGRRFVLGLCLLLCVGATRAAEPSSGARPSHRDLKAAVRKVAEAREVQPMTRKPDWASPVGKPVFSFAWITDVHLTEARLEPTRRALRLIDDQLRPDFVLNTGDNSAYAPPDFEPGQGSTERRRNRFFRQFVAENLRTPCIHLPGDNWSFAFAEVFGPFQFSFDVAGVHFVGLGLDEVASNLLEVGRLHRTTLDWLKDDLRRNADKPIVLAMHENIQPPTFLDAAEVDRLLEATPGAVATFTGHLHCDLEHRFGRVTHFCGPALGPHRFHPVKLVEVYPDRMIITTYHLSATSGHYEQAPIWQKVDFPAGYRLDPGAKPSGDRRVPWTNYACRPVHERRKTDELNSRLFDLTPGLMYFGQRTGMLGELLREISAPGPVE